MNTYCFGSDISSLDLPGIYSKQKGVCIAFVDLLKAFDNVNWKVMMKIVKTIKYATEIEELLENYRNIKRHLYNKRK